MQKILTYFTGNPLLVNVIMIVVVLIGVFSALNIRRDVFPPTDIDTMIIKVLYPGASSSDVELNAVIPLENEIRQIPGIREYVSLSIENGASIYIYLDYGLDNKQAVKDEIYRTLTKSNLPDIPDEVEDIIIIDINPKRMAVITLGITAKDDQQVTQRELFTFSDRFENQLLKLKGINTIRKHGYLDREILVDVNMHKIDEYYISLNDVVQSVQTRNIRSTGGTLQSLHKDQTIVTLGQFKNPLDIKNVIVRSNFEGKRVQIKDIATVQDGFEKENVLIRVNKKKAVIFQIVKKENSDVVKTVAKVKNFIHKNRESFPPQFEVSVLEDRSLSITSLVRVVFSNALIGFILIVIILYFFLDLKTSFWTAMGIPFSLLVVLAYMNSMGISVNIMSLGAIITVLGMMVDHGIVISETIYDQKHSGHDSIQSIVSSVQNVLSPVMATILTTIVSFIPLLYIKGMMGKFIYIFPLLVSVTLIISFLEAVFILPCHLAGTHKVVKKKKKDWFLPITERYEHFLGKALPFRYLIVTGFILFFCLTLFISQGTIKRFVLLWDNSSDAIYVNLESPDGTNLIKTETLTTQVEDLLYQLIPSQERLSIQTNIGHHTVKTITSKGNHENWSQILVNLVPMTERTRSAQDIIRNLRAELNIDKFPNFDKIVFEKRILGPPKGEPVNLKIISNQVTQANKAQQSVEKFLSRLEGIKDLDNDQKGGKEELEIHLDYAKLARLDLSVAMVAQTVRTAFEGTIATSVQTPEHKINYRIKVADTFQRDIKFLKALLIPSKQGKLIPLGEIASIVTSKGKTLINHYNGSRVITITANVDEKITTSSQIAKKLKKHFRKITRQYPDIQFVLGGEAKESKKTMSGLIVAFLVAILLIYLILLVLFRSLTQPLLVLLVVPFGLAGALLSFTCHGIPMTFMGVIGMIGLSGVVVNDSVIMVSFINRIIKESSVLNIPQLYQLISKGARQRFRAIILTTLTTVAALLPTVYGIGGSAKTLIPVVMAMAYGLLFATSLTLLLIPALYVINLDLQRLLRRNS
jgi:multidrug efflux pump subunit AcrB